MKITFNNKALKLETLEVSNFESVTGFVPLKVWLESKTCQLFPYQVVLGGGRRHFVPKVALDPEEPEKEGRRLDGRNLIEEWSRNRRLRNLPAEYVANKEQFDKVDPRKVNHLLGKCIIHSDNFPNFSNYPLLFFFYCSRAIFFFSLHIIFINKLINSLIRT